MGIIPPFFEYGTAAFNKLQFPVQSSLIKVAFLCSVVSLHSQRITAPLVLFEEGHVTWN